MVIQQIVTTWTRASRGGAGAVRRNAVPEAALVPVERLNGRGAAVVRHILRFVEDDGFSHPRERLIVEPPDQPLQVGCVTVTPRQGGALVAFQYDTTCGAPERWMRGSFEVGSGEWAQIVYNGRFSGEGAWLYQKVVVNAGAFELLNGDIFTGSKPAHSYAAMARLY